MFNTKDIANYVPAIQVPFPTVARTSHQACYQPKCLVRGVGGERRNQEERTELSQNYGEAAVGTQGNNDCENLGAKVSETLLEKALWTLAHRTSDAS